MALSEKDKKALIERRRGELYGTPEAAQALAEIVGPSLEQNQIPLLDKSGAATGQYYDRRLGAPPDAAPQPDAIRYLMHKQYLEQKYGTKFAPTPGQPIPEFDPIDPFRSDGLGSSIGNILASAYPGSLTGQAEAGIEKFLTGSGDANLFGLIDTEKQKHWQPNKAEEILTGLASFGIDIPALAGITAATGGGGTIPSVSTKVAQAAKIFGAYEGAKGFFEGYTEKDAAEGLKRAVEQGAKGAVTGAAFGGAGELAGGLAKGAVSRAVLPAASEVVTLATVQPFLEGRTPTTDDFINAAGFIVGVKIAGGIGRLSKSAFQKAVADEAVKLEEAGPEKLAEMERAAFRESPAFNEKILERIEKASPGQTVGTLGDFIVNERVRSAYAPALDTPIRVVKGEGEGKTGWVSTEDGKPYINIASDYPEFAGKTILHEGTHILQTGKGRGFSETTAEKMSEWATSQKPSGSNKAAEAAARRGWGRQVNAAKGKPIGFSETPEVVRKAVGRITKDSGEPTKVGIVTSASPNVSGTISSKILYGSNNEGVTVGYYEIAGKGKPKQAATILDITAEPSRAPKLVESALAQAEAEKTNLYLSKRVASSPAFKSLQEAGMVGKKTKSGSYRVLAPKAETKTLAEKLPTPPEKQPETARPATTEAPKVAEATQAEMTPEQAAEKFGAKYDGPQEGTKGKVYHTFTDQRTGTTVLVADVSTLGEKLATKRAQFDAAKNKPGGKAFRTVRVPEIRSAADRAAKSTEGLPKRIGDVVRRILRNPLITAVKPYERRITTPEGKEVVQMSYNYGAAQARIFHEFYAPVEKQLKALSDAQANSKNIASEFRDIFDSAHAAMKFFKPDLGYIENYTTRWLKPEVLAEMRDAIKSVDLDSFRPGTPKEVILKKIAERSERASKQLQFWLERGQIKNIKEGYEFLSRDLRRQALLEPSFFKKRTLDYMDGLYLTDIREILPRYLMSASKYIAANRAFGKDLVDLNERLAKLTKRGETDAQLVSDMVAHLTGTFDYDKGLSGSARKLADVYVGWQVGTKIGTGLATWLNVFQPLYSFMPKVGVFRSLGYGLEFLDPSKRAELVDVVKRSGALGLMEERVAQSLAGHRPGGIMGDFADKMTKYSGFIGINRWNLLWAGHAARRVIPEWYRQAQGTGMRAKLARSWLKEIGIEASKNDLTQTQLLNGIYRFATESQLQKLVMKEPSVFHHPVLKHFFLFKRYGYRQALWIGEMLNKEIRQGNYMPLIRLAVSGYLGGAGVVWGINKFKSFLSGEPVYDKSDSLYEEFVSRLGAMGAIGVVSDFMRIDKLSKLPDAARFTLSPVFASDIERIFDAYTKFMGDYEKFGDGWLATRRNAYNLVGPIGTIPRETAKRLMPSGQKSAREKYLKTKEKEDVMVLLMSGDHAAASRRVENWNKYHPELPLTIQDYSTGALIKWINNRAETYAKAKTGDEAGRDFALEERKRRLELLKEAGIRK